MIPVTPRLLPVYHDIVTFTVFDRVFEVEIITDRNGNTVIVLLSRCHTRGGVLCDYTTGDCVRYGME